MGKKAKDKGTEPAEPKGRDFVAEPPRLMLVLVATLIFAAARAFGGSSLARSDAEGRCSFCARVVLFFLLQAAATSALSPLLVLPARALARRLPGAVVPDQLRDLDRQEHEQHDPTLAWPLPGTQLPSEWVSAARARGGKQPYFLNHARGCVRIRQAALRVGAALGTLLQVGAMAATVDRRPPSSIGLELVAPDLALGVLTGLFIVSVLFAAEVSLGWLHVVRCCEVVVPGEWLSLNLLWDALFHVAVAVNEEVSLRGWLLVNGAHACVDLLGVSPAAAIALAVALQATLFALMHVGSPGATAVGLTNLVVGGAVGALNVFVTGGLSFSLGWHVGWNLAMGHLLGMSTSGIPMSAKLVAVVPHPAKAHLHGGRFGPEQSPLAAPTYLLGCGILVALYGSTGLDVWRARLAAGGAAAVL